MTDDENDRHGYSQPTLAQYEDMRRERDAARAELAALRERVDLAKRALVQSGYFTADQLADDIAPRITEFAAALAAWATPTGPTDDDDWDCGSGQCDPFTGCPACTDRDHWIRRS